MPVSRRTFIKKTAVSAAALSLVPNLARTARAADSPPLKPGACNKWPGRVVINFNKNAVVNQTTPQVDVIKKMVDDGIMALTGKKTVADAWKELFPATLSLQSKIAIKTNSVNTSLPAPHWSSVQAITDGLQNMVIDGKNFPAANITIYDMDFQSGMNKIGYTSANFPGIAIEYTKLADGGDGALDNHKYAVQLRDADFLINVFSPRGHSTEFLPAGSKFTLGFKSHVGTYSSEAAKEGPSLHADLPKNLREMSCTGVVYNKNVLSFCSGIFGMNEGNGPPGNAQDYKTYAKTMDASITGTANPTTIIMGTDPVAVEMQTIKMIRLNKSGKYGISDLPPYLQASAGISGALDGTTYNIGIIDESVMDIRRVINDVVAVHRPSTRHPAAAALPALHFHQTRDTTFFEFMLPAPHTGFATVSIVSPSGVLVKKIRISVKGIRNQFSWNHRGSNGSAIGSGAYIVRLTCGTVCMSVRCMVP